MKRPAAGAARSLAHALLALAMLAAVLVLLAAPGGYPEAALRSAVAQDAFAGASPRAEAQAGREATVLDFSRSADWLGRNEALLGARKLARVILPGAHDAASYSLHPGSGICPSRIHPLATLVSTLFAPRSRAQNASIAAQLQGGVRYLDLRVCAVPRGEGEAPDFVTHHTFLGAPLELVLDEVDAFTRAHPRELIILDFQHVNGAAPEDRARLAALLERRLGPRMLARDADLTALTLREAWARKSSLVVLMESVPAQAAHIFERGSNLDSKWADAPSLEALRRGLAELAQGLPRGLHVLQWQLTPHARELILHPSATLMDFAEGPNGLLLDGTLRRLFPPGKMNVVMTDDVLGVVESIARLNEHG